MEKSHMTDRILTLTMEIICLLTGERCVVVKMASIEGLLQGLYPPLSGEEHPITAPPPASPTPERNIQQKVLEVINQVMELLTGGEPGSPEICKEEDNKSERWFRLPYYRGSSQEDHNYYQNEDFPDINMEDEERVEEETSESGRPEAAEETERMANIGVKTDMNPRGVQQLIMGVRTMKTIKKKEEVDPVRGQMKSVEEENIINKSGDLFTGQSELSPAKVRMEVPINEREAETPMRGGQEPKERPEMMVIETEKEETSSRCDQDSGLVKEEEEVTSVRVEGCTLMGTDQVKDEKLVRRGQQPEERVEMMVNDKEGASLRGYQDSGIIVCVKEEEEEMPLSGEGCIIMMTNKVEKDNLVSGGKRPVEMMVTGKQENARSVRADQDSGLTESVKEEYGETSVGGEGCTIMTNNKVEEEKLVRGGQWPAESGEKIMADTEEEARSVRADQDSGLTVSVKEEEEETPVRGRWTTTEEGLMATNERDEEKTFIRHSLGRLPVHQKEIRVTNVHWGPEEAGLIVDLRLEDRSLGTHTGEALICRDCGKSCVSREDLETHRQSHVGFKPFKCSECGKCFTTKTSLNRHLPVHTGEKPFKCPECGKTFPQKASLLNHARVHTKERPFLCSVCGKSFAWKGHLLKHQRTHSPSKKEVS